MDWSVVISWRLTAYLGLGLLWTLFRLKAIMRVVERSDEPVKTFKWKLFVNFALWWACMGILIVEGARLFRGPKRVPADKLAAAEQDFVRAFRRRGEARMPESGLLRHIKADGVQRQLLKRIVVEVEAAREAAGKKSVPDEELPQYSSVEASLGRVLALLVEYTHVSRGAVPEAAMVALRAVGESVKTEDAEKRRSDVV